MRSFRRYCARHPRRGAILILVALLMIVFLAMAAFSVDVAYMDLVQTELRAATDAAARAGGEALDRTKDTTVARSVAKDVAARNLVAGKTLLLQDSDVLFGQSVQNADGSWGFIPDEAAPNSVRVLGKRTKSSLSGVVPLFFAGVLGTDYFEPTKSSTVVFQAGSRDICLVADRSHSMAWDTSGRDWTYPPGTFPNVCWPPHATLSRWGSLVAAVKEFNSTITALGGDDRVGLVTFASSLFKCGKQYNSSTKESDMTADFAKIDTALANITKAPIPGETNIWAGIQEGIKVLTGPSARPGKSKVLIVLTDGVQTEGPPAIQAVTDATNQGITIHTVTFSYGADKNAMQAIATSSGGKHYHANTPKELIDVYRQLAFATQSLSFAE